MRGTESIIILICMNLRIIPACAGNRHLYWCRKQPNKDHPRVCGEQLWDSDYRNVVKGSSPRVRGTVVVSRAYVYRVGIIPACAGNSFSPFFRAGISRDHPRVCGEQFAAYGVGTDLKGSSPRVRGTGKASNFSIENGRIIPACAGNSWEVLFIAFFFWDHPRVCGEQSGAGFKVDTRTGSSPRVRGTGVLNLRVAPVLGIIPACAGNRYE